jgi:hypothetical protein
MTERSRYDASQGPEIIGPRDGKTVDFGGVGVRFMVWGEESVWPSRRNVEVDH